MGCTSGSLPLLVDGQVSPCLEDAHVFARQRPAGEGIVGPVLGDRGLLGGRGMALEVVEPAAAAVLALDGLVVVPMRQVRIVGALGLAVGFDLDTLDAGAVVVVDLAFRHGCHFVELTAACARVDAATLQIKSYALAAPHAAAVSLLGARDRYTSTGTM